jgi:hypothetical protein
VPGAPRTWGRRADTPDTVDYLIGAGMHRPIRPTPWIGRALAGHTPSVATRGEGGHQTIQMMGNTLPAAAVEEGAGQRALWCCRSHAEPSPLGERRSIWLTLRPT